MTQMTRPMIAHIASVTPVLRTTVGKVGQMIFLNSPLRSRKYLAIRLPRPRPFFLPALASFSDF